MIDYYSGKDQEKGSDWWIKDRREVIELKKFDAGPEGLLEAHQNDEDMEKMSNMVKSGMKTPSQILEDGMVTIAKGCIYLVIMLWKIKF